MKKVWHRSFGNAVAPPTYAQETSLTQHEIVAFYVFFRLDTYNTFVSYIAPQKVTSEKREKNRISKILSFFFQNAVMIFIR